MRIITLTTDFGLSDGYVGTMKGVMLSIAPDVTFVDITHHIPPPSLAGLRQNIRQAAYVLYAAVPYFPAGTIHLAVVDPGVGSVRRALAVRIEQGFLIGPDNGLFTLFLAEQPEAECRAVIHPEYMLPRVSATFHGRDVFAPVAAHLARGASWADLGPRVTDPVMFPIPAPVHAPDGSWHGCVLYADHYGNLVTSVTEEQAPFSAQAEVSIGGTSIHGVRRTYAEARPGELVALIGSSGHLEISVVNGNAAQTLGLGPDAPITLREAQTT